MDADALLIGPVFVAAARVWEKEHGAEDLDSAAVLRVDSGALFWDLLVLAVSFAEFVAMHFLSGFTMVIIILGGMRTTRG